MREQATPVKEQTWNYKTASPTGAQSPVGIDPLRATALEVLWLKFSAVMCAGVRLRQLGRVWPGRLNARRAGSCTDFGLALAQEYG